jgi:hypothetical protein
MLKIGLHQISRHLDRAGTLILAAMAAAQYALAYRAHSAHPHIGGGIGWWAWFDQERYYASAVAWSQANLDPTQHWYLPGYSLMAAPFIRLVSVHAFGVVNLLCLLVSLVLFAGITARLARQIPHARFLGALVFTTVTCVSPLMLDSWVVPWTTSGATPITYACLLAALCFLAEPRRAGFAFWTGLAAGALVAFRPTDIVPLMAACAPAMLVACLRRASGIRPILAAAALGALGVAVSLGALVALYLALYGPHESGYIIGSGIVGFEWRMIPLRWVTLMLDPRPLFSDGQGMIEMFPWMVAGLAGAVAMLATPHRSRDQIAHVMVITAMALHIMLYLAYRDLHPDGLFRFRNYHYFKWLMPMLGLYGVLLVHALVFGQGRRLRLAATAAIGLTLLLPWRAELDIRATDTPRTLSADGRGGVFAQGLSTLSDAILMPAQGEWGDIYFGPQEMSIGGRPLAYFGDFRTFPRTGGFMLVPLRPLPSGPATLVMKQGITLDPNQPSILARQVAVPGLPCWLPTRLYDCPAIEPIAPPLLPGTATSSLVFNGSEQPYLGRGWSVTQPDGRWTEGPDSHVRMRLDRMDQDLAIAIDTSAYNPTGSQPVRLRLRVNGLVLTERSLPTGETVTLSVNVPAKLLEGADRIDLAFDIANPRAPKTFDRTSQDARELALFVRAIRVTPLAK